MPLSPQTPPPAVVASAPSLPQDSETVLLEAFDWGRPLPADPRLKGPAALDYQWLRAAATFDPTHELPASPYATGPARREAEALRTLLKAPKAKVVAALKKQSLHESGTALALWRWGQTRMRQGTFEPALRHAWEDRLMVEGPALTRGYALRHALCWALAEKDEARLVVIRTLGGQFSEETVQGVQRLFGVLGSPSPTLRLWSLPGLDYADLRLDQLKANRAWICPVEDGPFPGIPVGTAWIIPSESGALDEREASLPEGLLAEGRSLSARLRLAERTAHFAPSRAAFERLGLNWFPILIEWDTKGNVQSIRMGDAAPQKP